MTCIVTTDVLDPKEAKWQMNKATNNWCIGQWDTDTTKWVGKEIEICVKQVGNMNPSVYPVQCNLEKVLS